MAKVMQTPLEIGSWVKYHPYPRKQGKLRHGCIVAYATLKQRFKYIVELDLSDIIEMNEEYIQHAVVDPAWILTLGAE